MTKPVWSHILALSALKAHIVSCQEAEPRLQISACKSNSSQQTFSS